MHDKNDQRTYAGRRCKIVRLRRLVVEDNDSQEQRRSDEGESREESEEEGEWRTKNN